ncbi:SAM-dependent methyltransferase [Gimesia fumaroli]|jgi:cyclopropane-fatty-acyl-phospholipid synthase|uniref:Cyclopropane-fatty-acyl-phospholipid synthase n=1 Tax=Gimesia fumaroli TaxID=2527976 RepID=A0A518IA59_9PLAN|nr:cyclopropane-fatty-acyl-phospholipid synthase family protein [Gimesia fumaroli]QDV50001.1 Cyclopropane-fatty-acyl-phospholipid synthase [Gimesia fumaroli]
MMALQKQSDSKNREQKLYPGLIDSVCRKLLFKRLQRLIRGQLILHDGPERFCFGEAEAELSVEVIVQHPRFYRRAVLGGGLGIAQSLIDGDWAADDLTSLVRVFIRNLEVADQFERGFAWFRQKAARAGHWLRRNTRMGAARNIHAHYDLGNDFYQLFLDETMCYSSGVFEEESATMQDASLAKLDRACRSLNLQPEDHLLEIGTGWGGLAIYAAELYGCRVTTTTISQEQYHLAMERVHAAGLSDQVTVLLSDYRDLEGEYDKLVSIEMIEAVGSEYFETYFEKCSQLLRDDGMMFLQSIVIKDQRFEEYLRSVDFIRRYIFPGGCLPSVAAILQSTTRATDMRLLQLDDIAPHYAQTLRCWQEQFQNQLDRVRELGYSESFIRMWNYYFSYCEAAFEERQCNTVQMLFAKAGCRFDPVQRQTVERFVSQEQGVLA